MSDPLDLLTGLTEAQTAAVTHKDGPCLVVAGPGTGKTKVITSRIAYLIQVEGVPAEAITALTFTDKAAREMEERLDLMLPYGMTGATISTFHSYCADLLKRHAMLLGLDPAAGLLTTADEVSFLRQHLAELPTSLYRPSRNPNEFLRMVTNFVSKCQDEYLLPETVIGYAERQLAAANDEGSAEQASKLLELGRIYQVVQQLYADNSVLTYGDLIFHAVTLLREHPSVGKEEGERTRYLLVDEFQDTNFVQSEVARLLVASHRNIMVVGDDDQAIYSFRGANLGNIMNFTKTFSEARVITLADNFRSNQAILDSAYRLIQFNNPARLEVTENVSKRLTGHHQGGGAPEHLHFERSVFEFQAIAEKICELLDSEEYQPNDIAILVRSKSQVGGIEEALKSRGLESQFSGDTKFFGQPGVKTGTAYLRFLATPHHDLNLFYLMSNSPLCVDELVLHRYIAQARYETTSLYDYICNLPEEGLDHQLVEVRTFLTEKLRSAGQQKPSTLLLNFIKTSGWHEQLKESDDTQTLDQIANLYSELSAGEGTGHLLNVQEYIQHLDYLLATDEEITLQSGEERMSNGIQILTVHKSKGLEFPVVFVTNLAQGRFPGRNFRDSFPFPYELTTNPQAGSNLPEERRLAYVAVTRAKERLYLTSSEQYGESRMRSKISPFVVEAMGLAQPPVAERAPFDAVLPKTDVVSRPVSIAPAATTTPPRTHSVSSLETYQTCPLRYKYQYVLKLRTPSSLVANFGTSIHRALQLWFEARKRGEEPDLEAIYAASWVKGGYMSAEFEQQRYDEGLKKLRAYLATQVGLPLPTQLEFTFQAVQPSGHIVSGKIDRIDPLPDGRIKIVDYKTGENAPRDKHLGEDLPLISYAKAMEQAGREVGMVELHYLMAGETLSAASELLQREAVTLGIEATIQEISTSLATNAFPAKPDRQICAFCDYRDICPFRYGS